MSTFRSPVGPQPPKVYWRRRLLVALGALAVLLIVILIFVRPGSGAGSTGGSSAPPTTTASSPAASPATSTQTAGAACLPTNLKLLAVTDKTTYAAAEQPQISMSLTNTGTVSCTVNLGSTQQELIVTSGSEQIWDSKDCQTNAVDKTTTLQPNVAVVTPPIPWDRTRSSKTTCSATRPPVKAAGASYHLGVKVGSLASASTVQFILN